MRTFVIAEMGSSWLIGDNQSKHLRFGLKLIEKVGEAGADAVKVQWVSDPMKMAKRRKLTGNPYRHLAWPKLWHRVFMEAAHAQGMEYISTVFLPEDVAAVEPFVDRFKVASLECRSRSLWKAFDNVSRFTEGHSRKIFYSTGCMSNNQEMRAHELGATAFWLHCTAAYPCPPEGVNLSIIEKNGCTGLSDHTGLTITGALAVAAGAGVIEVHCRLDETRKDNPDYKHSHAPLKLKEYIANIRLAEKMMGDGQKKVEDCEKPLMKHRVTR